MEKARKMKCECGGYLKQVMVSWDGIKAPGLRCGRCREETVSSRQVGMMLRKARLEHALRRKRKILQVGNAMGITIPEELKNIGFRVGRRVRTELVGDKSLKVTVE